MVDNLEHTQRRAELLALLDIGHRCIDYVLHRSIEDENVFIFYENWTSKEDLDAHLQMPYLQAFVSKAEDLLGAPLEVNLLNVVA